MCGWGKLSSSQHYLEFVSIHFVEILEFSHPVTLKLSNRIVDDFGMFRLDKYLFGIKWN